MTVCGPTPWSSSSKDDEFVERVWLRVCELTTAAHVRVAGSRHDGQDSIALQPADHDARVDAVFSRQTGDRRGGYRT